MSNIALEAKTKEHKLLKAYLEANASECLIEKINNGVKIEKNGKTLINKKTLETFMAFATEEAKKQALFLCDKAYDILKTNNINSYILEGVLSDISEGIEKCC